MEQFVFHQILCVLTTQNYFSCNLSCEGQKYKYIAMKVRLVLFGKSKTALLLISFHFSFKWTEKRNAYLCFRYLVYCLINGKYFTLIK